MPQEFATTNAMMLYTTKGTSAWLVPLDNPSKDSSGNWNNVFIAAAL